MSTRVISETTFKMVPVTASITRPSNTTQYAIGDAISDTVGDAHFSFPELVPKKGGTAQITNALIISSAYQSTGLTGNLLLFGTDVGTDADNAPATLTDAEMLTLLGVVQFDTANWIPGTPTSGAGGNAFCQATPNIVIKAPTTTVYGFLTAGNTYTPVSDEVITIMLMASHDL